MAAIATLAETTPWYTWVFSGLGVSCLLALVPSMRRRITDKRGNNKNLTISTQNINLTARDLHECYDHALGIFISNAGNAPVHIQAALFRTHVPFLFFFRRRSPIPVYSKAFVNAEKRAYELKFGAQWYEHQVDIPPGDRVMTYLPLQKPVSDEDTNIGRLGEVLVAWSSQGTAGTHRVFV